MKTMKNRGYVHVYTGNGKGKTTAALGLTLRAAGAGKKVFIAQFVKGQRYSEVKAIEKFLPMVKIKQYGLNCFIEKIPHRQILMPHNKGYMKLRRSSSPENMILWYWMKPILPFTTDFFQFRS